MKKSSTLQLALILKFIVLNTCLISCNSSQPDYSKASGKYLATVHQPTFTDDFDTVIITLQDGKIIEEISLGWANDRYFDNSGFSFDGLDTSEEANSQLVWSRKIIGLWDSTKFGAQEAAVKEFKKFRGYNETHSDKIDFAYATGDFKAIGYLKGKSTTDGFDSMFVRVENGRIIGLHEHERENVNIPLTFDGVGYHDQSNGKYILKITESWQDDYSQLTSANDDPAIPYSPPVASNSISSGASEEPIKNNVEEYYYKVSWTPSRGAKAERCRRYDNSIGESCSEIGNLSGYHDAKGAILWDRGYSLGAILWTDRKVIYQGYKGNDGGTKDFMNFNDPTEFIQYCQTQGNEIMIVTNKKTYTRSY